MAATSTQVGQTTDPREPRSRCAIQRQRPISQAKPGYTSEIAAKIRPWLKNQSDGENERSASRSTVLSENGLRQSTRPSRNATQKIEPGLPLVDRLAAEPVAAACHPPRDLRPGERLGDLPGRVVDLAAGDLARRPVEDVDLPHAVRVRGSRRCARRVAVQPARDLGIGQEDPRRAGVGQARLRRRGGGRSGRSRRRPGRCRRGGARRRARWDGPRARPRRPPPRRPRRAARPLRGGCVSTSSLASSRPRLVLDALPLFARVTGPQDTWPVVVTGEDSVLAFPQEGQDTETIGTTSRCLELKGGAPNDQSLRVEAPAGWGAGGLPDRRNAANLRVACRNGLATSHRSSSCARARGGSA